MQSSLLVDEETHLRRETAVRQCSREDLRSGVQRRSAVHNCTKVERMGVKRRRVAGAEV